MERQEDHQNKCMGSQTRFFKVILHDTLQAKMLVVPKIFVQKYGRNLCSNKVYLKVSSGDIYVVGLDKEEDDEMWLLDGWQDFLEFYDIKFGYFLVFGYQGNSEFQVHIFNKTALEIKYPCKSKSNKKHNADVDPCLFFVKPEMEESDVEMFVDHNTSEINSCDKNTVCMGKGSSDCDYVNEELETSKSFSPIESKVEAIIRSTAFNSPNLYFRIIMPTTYVNGSCFLRLPGKFIMDHIGQKQCHLKLSVPCGRFWTVKCGFKMQGNRPEAKIQLGWKHFVRDNNLVVGDVCIFELIDGVEVHFQVTIFRASKDPSLSHCPLRSEPGECSGRQVSPKPFCHEESSSDILHAATSNHITKNPSFYLLMSESCMRSWRVPIRLGFLKHLKSSAHFVALEVAGRSWRVKVCFCQRRPRHGREAIFSSSWVKFARENSLRVGDVCNFELIEREEVVIKVSIHKGRTLVCLDNQS